MDVTIHDPTTNADGSCKLARVMCNYKISHIYYTLWGGGGGGGVALPSSVAVQVTLSLIGGRCNQTVCGRSIVGDHNPTQLWKLPNFRDWDNTRISLKNVGCAHFSVVAYAAISITHVHVMTMAE